MTRWRWSWSVATAAKPGWRPGWPNPATPRRPPAASRRRLIRSPPCKWFPLIAARFCCSVRCKSRARGELEVTPPVVLQSMPRKHRVVDHIVERLAAIGVDHIFGVDGANIEDLYDAAHFQSVDHRGTGQARVLRRHDGRRLQPQRGRAGCGGGDLGWRRAESCRGPGGVAGKPGSGVGSGRPNRHHHGRPRQLSGHQRPQRIAERRGGVFRGVGVVRAGAHAGRHRFGAVPGHRRGAHRRPGSVVAAQGHSAGIRRRSLGHR